MIGFGAIFLALIATCIAVFYYFNSHLSLTTRRSVKPSIKHNGLFWYRISAGMVSIAAGYLLFIILTSQFQYAYVYSYTSQELSLAYKLSAFWAGQEGSFMLWLLFHVMFGLMLAGKRDVAPGVMVTYSALQCLLLTILLAKSPFMMLSTLPADGTGLNPLLQDPWMVIHPPVVFLGYAGLAVPFSFALDGLLSNKHDSWVNKALPWTLLSWAALGAGIFIGGFWAYKVLGWGGYWAWDPVENSSLVPWLTAGALVHLLLLARIRPAGLKPAYVASIFTFVLILYGTYLTRSGILSDFSTHSFADEGIGGLLAGFVLITALSAVVLLVVRWPNLPPGELYSDVKSREFILACTGLVFAVLAVLVFIGMSTPLITALIGAPQNVNTAFYNATSLPLAVATVLLLTIGPALQWGKSGSAAKKVRWTLPVAVLGFAWAFLYGIHHPFIVLVIGFGLASTAANLYASTRKRLTWPAGLTHAGVAVMLVGIMISSTASKSETASFEPGQSKVIFGNVITYLGVEPAADGKGFYQSFTLEDGSKHSLRPLTKLNKEGSPAAREPGIHRSMTSDLYLAPIMKRNGSNGQEFVIRKGETTLQEGLEIKLVRMAMNTGVGNSEEIRVQVVMEISKEGQKQEIMPEIAFRGSRAMGTPVKVFDQYEITLNGVNPSNGMVSATVRNFDSTAKIERVDVEISKKPMVNLVWLGTVLITIGTCWAGYNRINFSEKIHADRGNGPVIKDRPIHSK